MFVCVERYLSFKTPKVDSICLSVGFPFFIIIIKGALKERKDRQIESTVTVGVLKERRVLGNALCPLINGRRDHSLGVSPDKRYTKRMSKSRLKFPLIKGHNNQGLAQPMMSWLVPFPRALSFPLSIRI